jgi:Acetyltransferase (GNAT) domain
MRLQNPVCALRQQRQFAGFLQTRQPCFRKHLSGQTSRPQFFSQLFCAQPPSGGGDTRILPRLVLFADDQPVALDYGYNHNRCFSLVEGSYDPAWSKAQVGSYNFVRILQDFETNALLVTTLDYLCGDNAFKIRTSNYTVQERHYYLFRKNISGAMLAGAMLATDALSRSLGGLLEKYGTKEKSNV